MKLNGNEIVLSESVTVKQLLESNGFRPEVVAVEVNGEICPKKQFDNFMLKNDDTVEVVSFVGGG